MFLLENYLWQLVSETRAGRHEDVETGICRDALLHLGGILVAREFKDRAAVDGFRVRVVYEMLWRWSSNTRPICCGGEHGRVLPPGWMWKVFQARRQRRCVEPWFLCRKNSFKFGTFSSGCTPAPLVFDRRIHS